MGRGGVGGRRGRALWIPSGVGGPGVLAGPWGLSQPAGAQRGGRGGVGWGSLGSDRARPRGQGGVGRRPRRQGHGDLGPVRMQLPGPGGLRLDTPRGRDAQGGLCIVGGGCKGATVDITTASHHCGSRTTPPPLEVYSPKNSLDHTRPVASVDFTPSLHRCCPSHAKCRRPFGSECVKHALGCTEVQDADAPLA